MTNTVLVTPDNWFDLLRQAAMADAGTTLEFTLSDASGQQPLADVSLGELRAVHHTYGAWWSELGGDGRPAALPLGAYDHFLSESRALLRRQAEAALASQDATAGPTQSRLAFPGYSHTLLSESPRALTFLKHFLWLPQSPSLSAWVHRLAAADDACPTARDRPWLRVLLQKAASENEQPDAHACLRAVYAGSDADRHALLAAEAEALDQCGLAELAGWARSLGLHKPTRTEPGVVIPARRPAPVGSTPDVTVLVPSYRHAAFIEAALDSVLAQTYAAFRVLVVDDRSPDDTVARAARIDDPRLQVVVNHTNLGLGTSVLRALDAIDTPYVALLNSDDLFHPERLERCRAALQQSPQAQVVATGLATIDADGRRLTVDNVRRLFDRRHVADWLQWHADTRRVAPEADLLAALLERNFLVTSSNIVARTDFLRHRADALRGLKYCLDWQIFLEAAADHALVHLPDELLGYRLHGTNTVWFDDARGAIYTLEVNRVLAHTLRQRQGPQSSPHDDTGLADVLDLLTRHAARHSDANGLAMYANELVGSRQLEEARERSAAVHDHLRSMSERFHAGRTDPHPTRQEALATAGWALADVAREDANVAREQAATAADVARREQEALHRLQAEREQVETGLRHRIAGLEVSAAAQAERQAGEAAFARSEMATKTAAQAAAHADELHRLRVSPEWLLGDRLWNRAGGSRIGEPAVRALHALRDRRNRWGLAAGRAAHRLGLARPRAVVAACWSFPIHSQTFVYQEMQALAWAGFDCTVFCCDTNAKTELPAAFSGLWDQRLVMQTEWRANQRDLDHFLRTRPTRVETLLARLGEATGLTREALLNESIVRTGFTFARHVEISGATYLHTYFFYDQSFLGLMAAYLLQIPRGITAYADHMLGDYPFKLVPLHLELADIVVATSARIKRELGAIGAGRFDDKIIVKPNGIDVARFPHIDTATRLAAGDPPELIAINRIEPKKGLIYLVDAIGLLKARGVPARLNLVGGADKTPAGAECHRQLVARIAELQLSDRIVLHGVKQQHEFAPLMARSRLFVAPYVEVNSGDKDGIPTAVLEAMSSGLPVVATDAGSILEAVADGVEGIAVPQRDPERLADAIQRLLTDHALFTRMSHAARQRAVGEFDIHVTERRLHERIQACLARPVA